MDVRLYNTDKLVFLGGTKKTLEKFQNSPVNNKAKEEAFEFSLQRKVACFGANPYNYITYFILVYGIIVSS